MAQRAGHGLTLDQKRTIFDEFSNYDKDRSGYISFDEAHAVLKEKLGFRPEQTRRMLKLCDKNNDGQLCYDEFIQFYQQVGQKAKELEALFFEIDTNKDGHVSAREARAALKQINFRPEEIDALVDTYDINHDGRLQYEEFVKLWNSF